MQNINDHKEKINQRIALCQDMCTLSLHMIDKLVQNNLAYSKKLLNNSFNLMQPVSSQGQQDFFSPLKNILIESIEDHGKLRQENQKVILETMDQMKASVRNKQ